MRVFIFIFLFVLKTTSIVAQLNKDSATEFFEQEELTIDLSNSESVDLILNKIHLFTKLKSIEFEGETTESTLKKIFNRMSVVKSITKITLRDNNLKKLPDNIENIASLNTLVIEGNDQMDFAAAFTKLSTFGINEIQLIDNNLKNDLEGIEKVSTLNKLVIIGNSQLNFEKTFDRLAKLPALTTLSMPINYIMDIPANIFQLKSLKSLDVSNNVLTELPEGVSALKAVNGLSINGNIIVNQVKELEKFKGADIRYLSIDKEISNTELEQIRSMFPTAELNHYGLKVHRFK